MVTEKFQMGVKVDLKRGMVLKEIVKNTPSDSQITISGRPDRAKSAESIVLVWFLKISGGHKCRPETRNGVKTYRFKTHHQIF